MASRTGKGKTCVAGGPGMISCTNNSYTPGVSMHIFPKDKKVRQKWVKFVQIHRPDFQANDHSALCSMHFESNCYTRLKLSSLLPDESESSSNDGNRREKRILIRGSLPSIQCANTMPEKKASERDRRRSKAVSIKLVLCCSLRDNSSPFSSYN